MKDKKKVKKHTFIKISAVLLAFLMVFSCLPVFNNFAYAEEETITWTLDENGTLRISGTGEMDDYVNASDAPWYSQRDNIKKVIIEDGITKIGGGSFNNYPNLESATIPNSVTIISWYAFRDCTSLNSIVIPESVNEIGYSAFRGCSNLSSITMPQNITNIEGGVFSDCISLNSIIIPEGLTTLQNAIFYGCSSLESVTLPNSLTLIGANVFFGCSNLNSIQLPPNLTRIDDATFSGCKSLSSITIPDGITSIKQNTFYDSGLTTVTLPDSIITIEDNAFGECNQLQNVYYAGTESQKSNIAIGANNNALTDANWVYETSADGNNNITIINTSGNLLVSRSLQSTGNLVIPKESLQLIPVPGETNKYYLPLRDLGVKGTSAIGSVSKLTKQSDGCEAPIQNVKLVAEEVASETSAFIVEVGESYIPEYSWNQSAYTGPICIRDVNGGWTTYPMMFPAYQTEYSNGAYVIECGYPGFGVKREGYLFDNWTYADGTPVKWKTASVVRSGGPDGPGPATTVYYFELTEDVTIQVQWIKDEHNLIYVPAKEATCTEVGNVEYWKCSSCGDFFADENAICSLAVEDVLIPAKNHIIEKVGENWYCSQCNEYFRDSTGKNYDVITIVNSAGHMLISRSLQSTGNLIIPKGETQLIPVPGESDKYYLPFNDLGVKGTSTLGSVSKLIKQSDGSEAPIQYGMLDQNRPSSYLAAFVVELGESYIPEYSWNSFAYTGPLCILDVNGGWAICSMILKGVQTEYSNGAYVYECAYPGADVRRNGYLFDKWTYTDGTPIEWKTAEIVQYGGPYGQGTETTVYYFELTEDTTIQAQWIEDGHNLVYVPAKKATCTQTGNIEHWACSSCGQFFADENATVSLANENVIIPATNHTLMKVGEYWFCSQCNKYFSDSTGQTEVTIKSEDAITIINSNGNLLVSRSLQSTGNLVIPKESLQLIPVPGETNKYYLPLRDLGVKGTSAIGSVSKLTKQSDGSEAPIQNVKLDAEEVSSETSAFIVEAGESYIPEYSWNLFTYTGPICIRDVNGGWTTYPMMFPAYQTEYSNGAYVIECGYPGFGVKREGYLFDNWTYADGTPVEWKTTEVVRSGGPDGPGPATTVYYFELTEDVTIQVQWVEDNHNLIHIHAKEATCIETGNIEYWECDKCHKYFSDTEGKNEISPKETIVGISNHRLLKTEAKEATCTTAGNCAYWTCNQCNQIFADEAGTVMIGIDDTIIVPKSHHLTKTEAKAPTCTNSGNCAYWTCDQCKQIFADEAGTFPIGIGDTIISPGNHHMAKTEAKAPTCTNSGNCAYWTCDQCNQIFADEAGTFSIGIDDTIIVPSGHHLTKTEAKAPTCTSSGNCAYWTCDQCRQLFKDAAGLVPVQNWEIILPQSSHTLTKTEAKDAMCTTAGNIAYWTCGQCNQIFADEAGTSTIEAEETVIAPSKHQLSKIEAKEATCSSPGNIEHWACTACGKCFADEMATQSLTKENVEIPPAHKLSMIGDNYVCSQCNKYFSDNAAQTEIEHIEERIYGQSRIDTALESADTFKQCLGVEKFDTVLIASGLDYPDALSGSYLAVVKNAPILLVTPYGTNETTKTLEYVTENLKPGGQIYLLGGGGVVDNSIELEMWRFGFSVKRLGGINRYETNMRILEEAGISATDEVLISSGTGYADSLSASSVGNPILLVGTTLTAEQTAFLKNTGVQNYCLVGGIGAVSPAVEASLRSLVKNNNDIVRLAGANRFQTSALVADRYFKQSNSVVFAYGNNFPDGLSGGPLASFLKAPVILLMNTDTAGFAKDYVAASGAKSRVTLGGPTLISDSTVSYVMGR